MTKLSTRFHLSPGDWEFWFSQLAALAMRSRELVIHPPLARLFSRPISLELPPSLPFQIAGLRAALSRSDLAAARATADELKCVACRPPRPAFPACVAFWLWRPSRALTTGARRRPASCEDLRRRRMNARPPPGPRPGRQAWSWRRIPSFSPLPQPATHSASPRREHFRVCISSPARRLQLSPGRPRAIRGQRRFAGRDSARASGLHLPPRGRGDAPPGCGGGNPAGGGARPPRGNAGRRAGGTAVEP